MTYEAMRKVDVMFHMQGSKALARGPTSCGLLRLQRLTCCSSSTTIFESSATTFIAHTRQEGRKYKGLLLMRRQKAISLSPEPPLKFSSDIHILDDVEEGPHLATVAAHCRELLDPEHWLRHPLGLFLGQQHPDGLTHAHADVLVRRLPASLGGGLELEAHLGERGAARTTCDETPPEGLKGAVRTGIS